jgi:hypothetical protein
VTFRLGAGVLVAGLAAVGACSREAAPTGAASSLETTVSAQSPAAAAATAFDGARAWAHLERIVAIGPRPSGSDALRDTRAYITRELAAIGLNVQDQRFTAATPIGAVEMENLVVRIPGRRPDRILLTGHYDTKRMQNARFVGASDGGSSAAFLLEAARVLKTQPGEFTYELIWFDGEEATCRDWNECGSATTPDNTYGSRYYVDAARKAGVLPTLKAMILVDMIGDRDLQVRRDSNSADWLNDIVWAAADRLAYGHIFVPATTTIEDDHVAFVRAGVPSIDIIDLDYPYWHTPDDTLDKVSQRSLQIIGDVVITALPEIEARLKR